MSYFDKTDGNMFVVNLLENAISLNKKGAFLYNKKIVTKKDTSM